MAMDHQSSRWHWSCFQFALVCLSTAIAVPMPAHGQSHDLPLLGQIGGYCGAVAVSGHHAFLADGGGMD